MPSDYLRRMRLPSTRTTAIGLGVIAMVALIGLAAVLFGPARGIRSDIGAQKRDIDAQRSIVTDQRELQNEQLEVGREARATAERTRKIAEDIRGIAEQLGDEVSAAELDRLQPLLEEQIRLSRQLESDSDAVIARFDRSLAIQLELLEVARKTLEEVRDINRKMPPPGEPVSPGDTVGR